MQGLKNCRVSVKICLIPMDTADFTENSTRPRGGNWIRPGPIPPSANLLNADDMSTILQLVETFQLTTPVSEHIECADIGDGYRGRASRHGRRQEQDQ
jgi:hypothetical protein